ncbi:MAG TPA: ribonuclease R [Chitinophagales bacterium]|nr:ribonuclease R [Chitinophagales bacterium]
MSKKKKINKDKQGSSHKRNKKDTKVNHNAFTVGEEMIGVIDVARSGDAFVVIDGKKKDFFIHRKNTNRAFDGDTVKVMRLHKPTSTRPEGIVTEIIKRSRTHFIGVVERINDTCFVVPDNTGIKSDFYVPEARSQKAKHRDKVVVEFVEWREKDKNPIGHITEILGNAGSNDVEMKSILVENGFFTSFPRAVLEEADALEFKVSKEEKQKRRDFSTIPTFTIDPADAKDFDDALSYRKLENGLHEVGVHIADVSHYVKEHAAMEKEAFKRATSVYLVDRVAPMFPERLSNIICSLRPNEDKCCYAAVFQLDDKANVKDIWFGRTVIHSQKRFTYEEAQEILEGNDGVFKDELLQLNTLAHILRHERFKHGSIGFEAPETKFKLDDNGKPIGVYVKERKDAHLLIEDFMLLANKAVATYIGKERNKNGKIPFVYRVHDLPNEEKLIDFQLFAQKFGYKIQFDNPKQIARELNRLMKEIEGKPEQAVLQQLAIRCMAKAIYTSNNIGHYGLGFEYYTHFTSPIRRYPDVMVHRLLDKILNDKKLPTVDEIEYQCKHSSERERAAADAERASVKYKMAEFMLDRIGEHFEGVISGVKNWGIYVELPQYNCEGLVRTETMRDDIYIFDERKMRMIGKRYDKTYQLGDAVEVKLTAVDIEKKTIDFELVTSKSNKLLI